jgi:hypothetical protein
MHGVVHGMIQGSSHRSPKLFLASLTYHMIYHDLLISRPLKPDERVWLSWFTPAMHGRHRGSPLIMLWSSRENVLTLFHFCNY